MCSHLISVDTQQVKKAAISTLLALPLTFHPSTPLPVQHPSSANMATEINKEAGKETAYVSDSPQYSQEGVNRDDVQRGVITDNADELHRRLSNRQIQLLAIGGSIGTALFVSIGNGLAAGGPGSLFLAYTFYSLIVACVNNCISEMIILQPVSGGFIRLATKWYDEALGFMVGWNFFIYEALLIPFEITAIGLVLNYWRDDIPPWSICIACIILYAYDTPKAIPLPKHLPIFPNTLYASCHGVNQFADIFQ